MAPGSGFIPLPKDHAAHYGFIEQLKRFTGMNNSDADLFLNKLDEIGGCVAGSFVLESILNKSFLTPYTSDIDIWIPHTKSPFSLCEFLFKNYNFKKQSNSYNPEYTRMFEQIDGMYILRSKNVKFKHIQIIAVKETNCENVVNGFDLTCVQTFFKNKTVFVKDTLLTDIEANTTGVTLAALNTQSYMEWFRTLDRLQKYMYRGFKVSHETWKSIVVSINKSIKTAASTRNVNFDGESIYFKLRTLPNHIFFERSKIKNIYQYSYNPSLVKTPHPGLSIPSVCFDLILFEDVGFTTYLDEKGTNRIIIIANNKAIGYDVDNFKSMLNDPGSIFYPCVHKIVNSRQYYETNFEISYIKVSLCNMNVFIPGKQAQKMIDGICKIWKLVANGKIPRSYSKNARNGNYVGAYHCQSGSELNLYDAHPIPLTPDEYKRATEQYSDTTPFPSPKRAGRPRGLKKVQKTL